MSPTSKPRLARLVAAFATVYLVWGSTYLAIKVGLGSLPPFLLGGFRFLLGGIVLLGLARWSGTARPTREHWRAAALTGVLMPLMGNGAVILAERRAPSGLVALIVTTVPIWMVLLDWIRPNGRRPNRGVFMGLGAGLFGMALLVNPAEALRGVGVLPAEALILVVGSVAWAAGSLYLRGSRSPGPASLLASLQMLVAGVGFLLLGTATGEWALFQPGAVSTGSWLAVAYLALFGSVLAYSAYVWLVRETTPARASTYAYVNPVVALGLGVLFGGEAVTGRIVLAAVVLVGAVLLINVGDRAPGPRRDTWGRGRVRGPGTPEPDDDGPSREADSEGAIPSSGSAPRVRSGRTG